MQIGDYVRIKDDIYERYLLGRIIEIRYDAILLRKEYLVDFGNNLKEWYTIHKLVKT